MTNPGHEGRKPFRRPVPSFGDNILQPDDPSKPVSDDHHAEAAHPGIELRASAFTDEAAATIDQTISNDIDPYEAYPLSVKDIRSRLFELGISKSKDSIQRYCREGMLDCVKLGMLRRYYVTEASVDALIETLQNDEAISCGMQLHEAERSGNEELLLLHGPASDQDMAKGKDLHGAAPNRMQADAAAHSSGQSEDDANSTQGFEPVRMEVVTSDPGMIDFLKDQLRVKDEQIKVKDEQIAAMLERDRETNILIRGLQDRIGDAFGLLVGGRRGARDHASDGEVDRPPKSGPSNPHVENRDGQ